MKNKKLVALLALSALMASSLSFADQVRRQKSVVSGTSFVDYGTLVSTEILYDEILKPVEVCRKEMIDTEVYENVQTQESPQQDSVAGVLIGGIAGGILGNQVGKGSGRDLATAAGAVTGAIVGNNLSKRNSAPQVVSVPRTVQKEVIMCHNENKTEKVVRGYNIEYSYNGRVFKTFMKNKPYDSKVRLSIDVTPIN